MKTLYKISFIAALFAIVSCKKDNPAVTALTIANSGTTVVIKPLQNIGLTLADDSTFTYNAPIFSSQTMKFLSHTHVAPAAGATYGTDTWEFATIDEGTEPLTITATLGDSTVTVFNASISVKP
jgi:predicted secreted protein